VHDDGGRDVTEAVTGVTALSGAERQRRHRERKRREREAAAGSGVQPDGTWVPAFASQRPPFTPGHEVSVTTGVSSERRIVPLAAWIEGALRADAATPGYLLESRFAYVVAAWSRAEAVVALLVEWLNRQDIDAAASEIIEEIEQESRPAMGQVKRSMRSRRTMSVLDQLDKHERRAANLRSRLGLDPAGYAKIAHDVAFTGKAADDAIERLGAKGREIHNKRMAEHRAEAVARGEIVPPGRFDDA
jgi:hypothetical protein